MIKVTRELDQGDRPRIRLEGTLDVAGAGEVRSHLDRPSHTGGRIDLTGLVSIDPAGADLLRCARARGWELVGGSLYIAMLLEENGSCPEPS